MMVFHRWATLRFLTLFEVAYAVSTLTVRIKNIILPWEFPKHDHEQIENVEQARLSNPQWLLLNTDTVVFVPRSAAPGDFDKP